jgi:hypothetical protein
VQLYKKIKFKDQIEKKLNNRSIIKCENEQCGVYTVKTPCFFNF